MVQTNPMQASYVKTQANKPTNNKAEKKHGKCSSNKKVRKKQLRILGLQDAPVPTRAWILSYIDGANEVALEPSHKDFPVWEQAASRVLYCLTS